MMKAASSKPDQTRVLCYHFAGNGDVISSLHVVKALHQKGYQVYMTSHPEILELLATQNFVKPISLEEAYQQKFDILLDFESSSSSAKKIRKLKAALKVGLYANLSKKIKNFFLYQRQLPKHSTGHIIRDYDVFLKEFDLEDIRQPGLEPKGLIDPRFHAKSGKKIGIHATARNALRVLPEELIVEVCKRATAENIQVYFLGSEQEIIESWIKKIPGSVSWFKGSLKENASLLVELDGFIGTDSGILHLNTALGKKSIGLFGPKRSEQVCPSGELVKIIEKDYPCRPCNQNKPCPFQKRCLTWVSPDLLWSEVKAMIKA